MTIEVSWFSALCDDDYEFLGQPDEQLLSSWPHCRNIVLAADRYGYDNVLLPSGYGLGIDNTAFAAAVAPLASHIREAAGVGAFILSGYPHQAECDLFARYVLPELDHGRLEFEPAPVNLD